MEPRIIDGDKVERIIIENRSARIVCKDKVLQIIASVSGLQPALIVDEYESGE